MQREEAALQVVAGEEAEEKEKDSSSDVGKPFVDNLKNELQKGTNYEGEAKQSK